MFFFAKPLEEEPKLIDNNEYNFNEEFVTFKEYKDSLKEIKLQLSTGCLYVDTNKSLSPLVTPEGNDCSQTYIEQYEKRILQN